MGKTVPSYRMALEDEIFSWRKFKEALDTQDQEAFEALMDASRNNCMVAGNAPDLSLRAHGHVDNALSTEKNRQVGEGANLVKKNRKLRLRLLIRKLRFPCYVNSAKSFTLQCFLRAGCGDFHLL